MDKEPCRVCAIWLGPHYHSIQADALPLIVITGVVVMGGSNDAKILGLEDDPEVSFAFDPKLLKIKEELEEAGCQDVTVEFDKDLRVFKSHCTTKGKGVEGRGNTVYHALTALRNSILVAQRATP